MSRIFAAVTIALCCLTSCVGGGNDPLSACTGTSAALKEGPSFIGLNCRGVNLTGANLRGADLRGADLNGADLWGANLYMADLQAADLEDAWLDEANLTGTKYDNTTIWPKGFTPPPSS